MTSGPIEARGDEERSVPHTNQTWTASSIVGLAIVSISSVLFSIRNRNYELDDALIYYRYVRNVLDGSGLVYNPGEYVNALSSPLHSYLSIAVCSLFGSIRYPMIVQSTVFMIASTVVLYALYNSHERNGRFVLLGGALIATWSYFHSLYGMETPLFLFLLAVCLLLYERRQIFWLGITSALLVLARGEGILLVLVMAAVHLARKRPLPPLREFAIPAVLLGGNAIFHRLYYGSFVPHTLMAKVNQGRSGLWGEGLNFLMVDYQVEWYFGGSRVIFATWAALAILGILRLGRIELNIIILGFLSSLTAFYTVLNVPNYHWYYAPLYTFGCMYVGVGAAGLFAQAGRIPSVLLASLGRTAVIVLAVGWVGWSSYAAYTQPVSATERQREYRLIGRWLKENTSPYDSVAMVEIGIIGFYSERRIVDILGLISPKNAESLGRRRYAEWLRNYQPDFILVHEPPWPQETRTVVRAMRRAYSAYEPFDFPGYVLLARRRG